MNSEKRFLYLTHHFIVYVYLYNSSVQQPELSPEKSNGSFKGLNSQKLIKNKINHGIPRDPCPMLLEEA